MKRSWMLLVAACCFVRTGFADQLQLFNFSDINSGVAERLLEEVIEIADNHSEANFFKRALELFKNRKEHPGLDGLLIFAKDMVNGRSYYNMIDALIYTKNPRVLGMYKPAVAGLAVGTSLLLWGGSIIRSIRSVLGCPAEINQQNNQETTPKWLQKLGLSVKDLIKLSVVGIIALPLLLDTEKAIQSVGNSLAKAWLKKA